MKLLDTRFTLYDGKYSNISKKTQNILNISFKKTNSTVRLEFRLNLEIVQPSRIGNMQKLQFVTGSPIRLKL